MKYQFVPPSNDLSVFVNGFWHVDSEGDKEIRRQKIIPDGFPEVIFHYADPYRINIGGDWETQPKFLLAGQIKNHFHLENTGKSGMIGIKFQPAGIARLYGIDMGNLTDKVIALPEEILDQFSDLTHRMGREDVINLIEQKLVEHIKRASPFLRQVDKAIELILLKKGMVSISELCTEAGCSERQLERQFKTDVGVSPKFYCRIIRIGHIFELMQEGDTSWADLVYRSGFYDQSHFIKNFKEFTGEDPSSYGFDERSMANFHFNKR